MKYITLKVNYNIVNNQNEIISSHESIIKDTTKETVIYILGERLCISMSCINITALKEV